MITTKIWYSVENCGDGSAYPRLMESEELCELDQEHMDEGWGEPCIGYIEVKSNGPIKVTDVQTAEDVKKDIEEWLEDEMEEYAQPYRDKLKAVNALIEKNKKKKNKKKKKK